MKDTIIQKIFSEIEEQKESLLTLLVSIAKIPSPSGFEQEKAKVLLRKLKDAGLTNVRIDKVGNCVGEIEASKEAKNPKTILLTAHMDTACAVLGEIPIREDNQYIYGHGVCDNTAGIVGLLTALQKIRAHRLLFPNKMLVVFTVKEEGLGAKRGMKEIIQTYAPQIDVVINVESHNIGRATHRVIGQYRSEIRVNTKEGGHSFRDFGKPNAIVILSQIVSDFSQWKFSKQNGKTTYNIGKIEGGEGINAIPKNAHALFEIRSENKENLLKGKRFFEKVVVHCRKKYPTVEILNKVLAEVYPVSIPTSHKLCRLVKKAQNFLHIETKFDSGNTDGDVSLAQKIPTVTIGTSIGFKTHSLDEYMEKKPFSLGVKQVFFVLYTIASYY